MDGIQSFYNIVGVFFQYMPVEVIYLAGFAFVGFCIIGLLGWFK